MNYIDKQKAKRITDTFNENYAVTRMYKWYLEVCPEFICREMVEELTRGGEITKRDAIIALLAELFNIDQDKGAYDRRIYRTYLTNSVRLLDYRRYLENPYYKNIKIPTVSDGSWEFKTECYPAYRGVIANDMMLMDDFVEIPPLGFFEKDFYFPAVLEGGNEWMTLTPVDIDTCDEAIERAHGRVVTFGLGLGYYTYMVSLKEEVESVTVIEKSPEVIRLFEKYILPQFPNKDKVKIIVADAYDYLEGDMQRENFDVSFVDIWRDASDGTPVYKYFKAREHLAPKTEFIYWIENFLISRSRAERLDELIELVDNGDARAPRDYSEFVAFLKEPIKKTV